MVGVFVLGLASVGVLIGVAYANTPVPTDAQTEATKQQSSIYYSDGQTLIARIGVPRVNVEFKDIPPQVREAVMAIEDHNFEHEAGISPTGLVRAVFSTASGAQTQGGSTITQQMARNYYQGLSTQQTYSRKLKEILISVRLGNEKSKEDILKTYLNTVNLGRGAYGIQAAATAYFQKNVKDLTVSEGAMLAAMIQRPSYFHTTGKDQHFLDLKARWSTTLDNMVKYGWLTQADRSKITTFPTTKKEWTDVSDSDQSGQNGYLKQRVLAELKKLGISDQLGTGGYKIVTTFDPKLQKYSADLIKQVKKENKLPKTVRFGLATVDPTTGGVVAAYGGPGYAKQQFDDSYQAEIQPGSSFKPYVLATALKEGYGLKSLVNGNSPQTIEGHKFTNDSKSEQGVFDFVKMTAKSINTAYVWLGTKVGLDKVVDTAVASGIPKTSVGMNKTVLSLPLGPNLISPVDQASGYATFANGGKHIETHVIKLVLGPDNVKPAVKPVKLRRWKTTEAFPSDVAKDATYAMEAVVKPGGTGTRAALPDGRPVAGKTGTTSGNVSAWFSGFTPQYATAVAMWNQKGNKLLPLTGIGGYSQIYGGTIPAETFSRFMTKALEKKEIKQFDPPVYGGTVQKWATPKATPTQTVVPSPTLSTPCQPNGHGNGHGNGNGQPCPNSSSPSTTTSPGAGQPCDQFNMPLGCDQDKPPSTPPPKWFCTKYQNNHGTDYPGCSTKSTGPPGGGGTGALGVAQPPARTEE